MSKQKKKQQNLNVVSKSDAAKKKKKKKPSTNGNVSSKSGDRLKNLLTCPDSVLTESNIKVFVNEEAFLKLPSYLQYKLISMLPTCDQNHGKDGGLLLSEEAFSNEFFTKACEEWRSKLAEGCFTDDRIQHMSIERGRQQAIDAWKIRHFESTVSSEICNEGPVDPAGKKRKCEVENEAGGNGRVDLQESCSKKLKTDVGPDSGDSSQLHIYDHLRLSFLDQLHCKTADQSSLPGAVGLIMQSKTTEEKQSKRNHKIRPKISDVQPFKMAVDEKLDERQKSRLSVNPKLLLKNQIESRRQQNNNKNKPTSTDDTDRTSEPVTSRNGCDSNNNEQNSKKVNGSRSSVLKSGKTAPPLANRQSRRTGNDVKNDTRNKVRRRQVIEEIYPINCKDSEDSKTPGTSKRSASGKQDETLFGEKKTSHTNDTVTLSDLITREYELLSRGTSSAGPKSTAILKPESLKSGFLNGSVSYSSSTSRASGSIKNDSSFSCFSPSSSTDNSLKTFLQSPTKRRHETIINSPHDHNQETSSTDTVISDASDETLFSRRPYFSFNGLRPLAEIYPLLGKSLKEVKAESRVVEPSISEIIALSSRQKSGAVERETLLSLVNKLNRNSSSRTGSSSIFDLLRPLPPHSEAPSASSSTSPVFNFRKEGSLSEIASSTSLSNALLAKLSKCLTATAPASSRPTPLLQHQVPDFQILKNILSSGSKLPSQTSTSPDSMKMTLQSPSQLELLTKKFLPQLTQDGVGLREHESRAVSASKEKLCSKEAPVSLIQSSNHNISVGLVTKCNDATDVMISLFSSGYPTTTTSQSSSPAKSFSISNAATTSGIDSALDMLRSATEVSSDHRRNASPRKSFHTMPDEKPSDFLQKPFFLTLSSTEQAIPTILVHHLPTDSQKLRPPLPSNPSAGYPAADRSAQSKVPGSPSPASNLTASQQGSSLSFFFSSSSSIQSNNSSKLSFMGGNGPRLQGSNTISTSLSSMAAMTNQVFLQNLILPQRLTALGSNRQQPNATSKFTTLPIATPSIMPQIRRPEGQFLMPTQPLQQHFGMRSGPTVTSLRALDKTSPQLPIAALLAQNAARLQTSAALSSQFCKVPQSIPNCPPPTSMSLIILSPFGQQQQGSPVGSYPPAATTVRPQNESMRSSEVLSNGSLQVNHPMLTYLPLLTMAQSAPAQHVSPGGNGINGLNQQQIVFLPTQNNSSSVAIGGSMSPYMTERVAAPCNGALKNLTFIPIVNGNSSTSGGPTPSNNNNTNQLLFLLSPQANSQK